MIRASSDKKKKVRFFSLFQWPSGSGPPMVPPKSFQRRGGILAWHVTVKFVVQLFSGLAVSCRLTLAALLLQLLDASLSLRKNSYKVPWYPAVPALVTTLIRSEEHTSELQ